MTPFLNLVVQFSSLALLIFVWILIIRGKLRPAYAIVWFGSASVFFIMSLIPSIPQYIAEKFGVSYTPSVVFALGLFFLISLILVQTVVISELAHKTKELAEHLAIIKWQVSELEKKQVQPKIVDKGT